MRQKKGLTQTELSLKTGIGKDEISLLERDKIHNPRLKTVLILANFFNVSIDWLCNRDNINYLTKLEINIIQKVRSNKLNLPALVKALDYYDNPTELGEIQKKIHELIPFMTLEIAYAAYQLLTTMVEM